MSKRIIAVLIIFGLAGLAWTDVRWVPGLPEFAKSNKDSISGISNMVLAVAAILALFVAVANIFVRVRRTEHVEADLEATPPPVKEQITREVVPPQADSLHPLPPPPGDFKGREDELDVLLKRMERGGVNISGIRGMGGIGKTALALKLAEQLAPRYPDAQIYLNLRGAGADVSGATTKYQEPLTSAEAMAHVIRSFNPTVQAPESEAELGGMYMSVLNGKRTLLLMDNALDGDQVAPLIPPEGCVLIVTSRRHFTLPGLFAKDLDTMKPDDARGLLLAIAPRIADEAGEIANLCGYLPMALRTVASALAAHPDLPPSSYVERLAGVEDRLRLVEESLALSYELLSPEMQELWRKQAVFPDTFDVAAVAAVWEMGLEATRDELSGLRAYSLVEWSESTGRYGLHDLALSLRGLAPGRGRGRGGAAAPRRALSRRTRAGQRPVSHGRR